MIFTLLQLSFHESHQEVPIEKIRGSPHRPPLKAKVIVSEQDGPHSDGSYYYHFVTDTGISREEQGRPKTPQILEVKGKFAYEDPEGVAFKTEYIADEKGFRIVPEGTVEFYRTIQHDKLNKTKLNKETIERTTNESIASSLHKHPEDSNETPSAFIQRRPSGSLPTSQRQPDPFINSVDGAKLNPTMPIGLLKRYPAANLEFKQPKPGVPLPQHTSTTFIQPIQPILAAETTLGQIGPSLHNTNKELNSKSPESTVSQPETSLQTKNRLSAISVGTTQKPHGAYVESVKIQPTTMQPGSTSREVGGINGAVKTRPSSGYLGSNLELSVKSVGISKIQSSTATISGEQARQTKNRPKTTVRSIQRIQGTIIESTKLNAQPSTTAGIGSPVKNAGVRPTEDTKVKTSSLSLVPNPTQSKEPVGLSVKPAGTINSVAVTPKQPGTTSKIKHTATSLQSNRRPSGESVGFSKMQQIISIISPSNKRNQKQPITIHGAKTSTPGSPTYLGSVWKKPVVTVRPTKGTSILVGSTLNKTGIHGEHNISSDHSRPTGKLTKLQNTAYVEPTRKQSGTSVKPSKMRVRATPLLTTKKQPALSVQPFKTIVSTPTMIAGLTPSRQTNPVGLGTIQLSAASKLLNIKPIKKRPTALPVESTKRKQGTSGKYSKMRPFATLIRATKKPPKMSSSNSSSGLTQMKPEISNGTTRIQPSRSLMPQKIKSGASIGQTNSNQPGISVGISKTGTSKLIPEKSTGHSIMKQSSPSTKPIKMQTATSIDTTKTRQRAPSVGTFPNTKKRSQTNVGESMHRNSEQPGITSSLKKTQPNLSSLKHSLMNLVNPQEIIKTTIQGNPDITGQSTQMTPETTTDSSHQENILTSESFQTPPGAPLSFQHGTFLPENKQRNPGSGSSKPDKNLPSVSKGTLQISTPKPSERGQYNSTFHTSPMSPLTEGYLLGNLEVPFVEVRKILPVEQIPKKKTSILQVDKNQKLRNHIDKEIPNATILVNSNPQKPVNLTIIPIPNRSKNERPTTEKTFPIFTFRPKSASLPSPSGLYGTPGYIY